VTSETYPVTDLQDPIDPMLGSEHAADIIKAHWTLLARSAQQRIRDEAVRLSARRHKATPVLDALRERLAGGAQ
jgi:hypothetical protein